ncbi:hypothetical protein U0Q88_004565 [Lactiplantibacillus plantarum]|mgnify:CR=1 FL=1|uniref:hypothetical protein n=1 Tax=Lactiplantibacillus plantarum TaxID=1590 RepID=UPI000D214A4B|nr:hypothetical protein [Lactiplantibacillus plantarum]AVV99546.1 hypothetical protein DA080_10335 [Lactiplantibacillus plantarum]MCC9313474.1 hypothetical protein [Lactiplantibacillus plantarum]MDF3264320.1 hypothetical protein [Lactiplantibacillus plantarum]MDO1602399.1 hypothetical protein [Lactiplantibacillus plantarum]MEE4614865.1 hypothetical protein [Lactiplantibacillus plantarum]
MSITLKDAVKTVTDAVDAINKRFPIKWEDITNKPNIDITDYYTKEEVNALLKNSHQLTSPDGSNWSPSIDDNGTLIWKKENNNGGS